MPAPAFLLPVLQAALVAAATTAATHVVARPAPPPAPHGVVEVRNATGKVVHVHSNPGQATRVSVSPLGGVKVQVAPVAGPPAAGKAQSATQMPRPLHASKAATAKAAAGQAVLTVLVSKLEAWLSRGKAPAPVR